MEGISIPNGSVKSQSTFRLTSPVLVTVNQLIYSAMSARFQNLINRFNDVSNINKDYDDPDSKDLIYRLDIFALLFRFYVWICQQWTPIYVKIPSSRLKHQKSLDNSLSLRVFIPYNPFLLKDDLSRYRLKCSTRALVNHIVLFYLFCRLLFIGVFQAYYEKLLVRWLSELKPNVKDACIVKIPPDKSILRDREILEKMGQFLNKIGSTGIAVLDMLPFVTITFALIYLIIAWGGVYLYKMKCPVAESLTFLFKPEQERKRIDKLIEEVTDILSYTDIKHHHSKRNQIRKYTRASEYELQEVISWSHEETVGSPCSCEYAHDNRSRYPPTSYHGHEGLAKFVRPRCLTGESYHRILKNQTLYVSSIVGFGFIIGLIGSYVVLYDELVGRVTYRLEQESCKQLDPTAIPVRSNFILAPLDDDLDIKLYRRYMNNSLSLLELVIRVEIPIMFWGISFEFLFDIGLMFVALAIICGSAAMKTLCSRYWLLIWMDQILEQIRLCSQLLAQLNIDKTRFNDPNIMNIYQSHVESCLMITYINFTCLRYKLQIFNKFLYCVCNILVTIVIVAILTSYIFKSGRNDSLNHIHILLGLAMIIVNTGTHISASITKKIQSIFAMIIEIQARCCLNGMEQTYTTTLWRKNMLDEDEVQNIFGVSLLGIPLNYSSMIEFNSYVLGFVIFVRRLL